MELVGERGGIKTPPGTHPGGVFINNQKLDESLLGLIVKNVYGVVLAKNP